MSKSFRNDFKLHFIAVSLLNENQAAELLKERIQYFHMLHQQAKEVILAWKQSL